MDVVDAVGELVDERGASRGTGARSGCGSKLIPKPGAVADRRQRLARGDEVVGDLGRVDLEREAHALGVEDVEDRAPALGEVLVAALDLGEVVGRERVEHVPDRRAGEAGDDRRRRASRRRARCPSSPRRRAAARPPARRRPTPRAAARPGGARRSGRRPPGRRGGCRSPSTFEAVALEQLAPARAVAGVGERLRRRRSGRPSRRARGRRSPTRRPSRRARSSGRSAHWPVNSVTGRAMWGRSI